MRLSYFFFLLIPRPPISTLFPYTTLFRSGLVEIGQSSGKQVVQLIHQSETFSSKMACKSLITAGYQLIVLRSEEHTSELQSRLHLVCRLLLEKKKILNQMSDMNNLQI